jgi:hypothetical protein
MKKVILRTPMRTRSNSFSDVLFKAWSVAPSVGVFSKLTTKPTKPSKPTENQRIFNQIVLFASVVSFTSGSGYLAKK